MKRIILIFTALFSFAVAANARQTAMIHIRVEDRNLKEIVIFHVENGAESVFCTLKYDGTDYVGLRIVPGDGKLFTIGRNKTGQTAFYLTPGDEIELTYDSGRFRTTESPTSRQGETLARWEGISEAVRLESIHRMPTGNDWNDFFTALENTVLQSREFKKGIDTGDSYFDRFTRSYIDMSLDYYAIQYLLKPRSSHPQKSDYPPYYKEVSPEGKLDDALLLDMPFGMNLLGSYTTYYAMEHKAYPPIETFTAIARDPKVKGEIAIMYAGRTRKWDEYNDIYQAYKDIMDNSQLDRIESIGAPLYDTRSGAAASDFTYPDIEGNMVSLSDFKGKVVLIDVWATWCGPCKMEIPHLKTLEHDYSTNADLVVMSVSVDEGKNIDKWKQFVADEGLGGVQLFADGWSKITKDYQIKGIPRFMVIGKDGSIVDSNSPRPSDPALRELLDRELAK